MNYEAIYDRLINRSKNRVISGYYEHHHIIPRCVGGDDSEENITLLTPEEHYIAHLLLIKMNRYKNHYNYRGLVYSAHMLTIGDKQKNKRNNKSYGWVRRKRRELGISEEHKNKTSKTLKGKNKGAWLERYGKEKADIMKRKLSILASGRTSANKGKSNPKIIGIKNKNNDPTIYDWYNPAYGTLTCTKYELIEKYPNLILNCLSPLIRNKKKNYKGWSVKLTDEIKKNSDERSNKNQGRRDKTIYNWYHPIYGEENLSRYDLSKKYSDQSISTNELMCVIKRKSGYNSHRGWRIKG